MPLHIVILGTQAEHSNIVELHYCAMHVHPWSCNSGICCRQIVQVMPVTWAVASSSTLPACEMLMAPVLAAIVS